MTIKNKANIVQLLTKKRNDTIILSNFLLIKDSFMLKTNNQNYKYPLYKKGFYFIFIEMTVDFLDKFFRRYSIQRLDKDFYEFLFNAFNDIKQKDNNVFERYQHAVKLQTDLNQRIDICNSLIKQVNICETTYILYLPLYLGISPKPYIKYFTYDYCE